MFEPVLYFASKRFYASPAAASPPDASCCCQSTYSPAEAYSPCCSKYASKRSRKGSPLTVSLSATSAQCRRARVTATFMRRLSARKPTCCAALLRTCRGGGWRGCHSKLPWVARSGG